MNVLLQRRQDSLGVRVIELPEKLLLGMEIPGRSIAADDYKVLAMNQAIGFRVAIDLTSDSLVPYRATVLGDNRVYFFEQSISKSDLAIDPSNLTSPDDPKSERRTVVVIRDVLNRENFPYAVEWEDIEIERAESRETPINVLNEKVKWQRLDIAANQRNLARYTQGADPVAELFRDKVLTSPVPGTATSPGISFVSHQMVNDALQFSPKTEYGQMVLVRFVDLTTAPGMHYVYRYRVKYRIPYVEGDSSQLTAWRECQHSVGVPNEGM